MHSHEGNELLRKVFIPLPVVTDDVPDAQACAEHVPYLVREGAHEARIFHELAAVVDDERIVSQNR